MEVLKTFGVDRESVHYKEQSNNTTATAGDTGEYVRGPCVQCVFTHCLAFYPRVLDTVVQPYRASGSDQPFKVKPSMEEQFKMKLLHSGLMPPDSSYHY